MTADPIHEAELLAADAIGDVIEHWGFRKGLGRLWTVLFIAGEPMPAQAIGERLTMSAGAVSMSLTELQRWGVVHRVWRPGERKEFFEAETDFWRMISKVFDERERLLAESVRGRLEKAVSVLQKLPPAPSRRARSIGSTGCWPSSSSRRRRSTASSSHARWTSPASAISLDSRPSPSIPPEGRAVAAPQARGAAPEPPK